MSLKQIAERAGTSVATVSRVLNSTSYQCQDKNLTEKIRQTARDLHYTPNQHARSLKLSAQKNGNTASFLIDILLARFDTLEQDPFFAELFRCVETEFHRQGCIIGKTLNMPDITLFQTKQKPTRADGLVILGKCPADTIDSLRRAYRGIIAIDRNPTDYKIDEVVCNGAHAAATAVEYLLGLGHKKIAYIGDCNTEARYMGYYECLLAHKIPLTYDYVVPTSQTKEDGYRAFEKIAACKTPPTAVFCANDITALGFLQAMKEKGRQQKKNAYQPAVISIDDIDEASRVSPLLTTVRIPKEDMVHLAVTTLNDRLQNGHRETVRLELPCRLMIRESSGMHLLC